VGAALTVIGRPVVAGRGAAQHSIFRSRRIFQPDASKRISDSLWPFGKAPFCFCGNLSGCSLLVLQVQQGGLNMIMRRRASWWLC
jgi:hypothetical protein